MFAGNDTTTNLIRNEMLALLQNLDQLWLLQGNAGLIGLATEGLSRYDNPVQETARMVNVHIEIGGKVIKAGELVMLCYTSVNRDPKQLEDPNRLNMTRAVNRHSAFAQGIHHCLGFSGPSGISDSYQRLG